MMIIKMIDICFEFSLSQSAQTQIGQVNDEWIYLFRNFILCCYQSRHPELNND